MGMRARSPPRGWVGTRGGGGSGACAVCGVTSRVGRGAGRCWWTVASIWFGRGRSVGLGCELREVAGRGASCFGRGALRHEGGGDGGGDGGRAPCWVLLPSGLGQLGPNVIEDVLMGSGSRCRRGAGLGLGFGPDCGLRSWRADGFGWLFGGGPGLRLSCGCGPRRGLGLGGGGVDRGGDGFGG